MFARRIISQDERNRTTWQAASSRDWLDSLKGFTDEGERRALAEIEGSVRGTPLLDLGVGTGRTIPLLRELGSEYRAIDYLPSMVEAARARYPGVRIDLGDARALDGVPDAHFGLVNFSFNGIDAVGAEGRRRVLAEALRVLRPGGVFFFSTLNLEGPQYRERPWHRRLPRTGDPVRTAYRTVRMLGAVGLDAWNWLRLRRATEVGAGYAVAPLSAHHYGVLAHFITLSRQMEELAQAGFAPEVEVLDNETGDRVNPRDDLSQVSWFHVLARRPL
jgi:SAM-dependent methyltransferase